MYHPQITEVETDNGVLFIDTDEHESILVEKFNPSLSHIDLGDSTLIIDHDTRESVVIERDDDPPDNSKKPTSIQAH